MKDLKINIVNAHELDPNKKYILELPNENYSMDDAHQIANTIYELGIKGIVVVNRGKESIKVIEAK